jgi:four helix bundle protein
VSGARKHHELKAWQEAMELVKEIYRLTQDFPKEEVYGLVSQMRRAAVSVPSNISEGAARGGNREFITNSDVEHRDLKSLTLIHIMA